MTSDYKADLEKANEELAQLLDQQEHLELDIAQKRYQIAALMALTEDEEVDQRIGMTLGGLTEAVLTAIQSAESSPLTPVQVRDRLKFLGFPTEHYKNLMAAIHTVIERLQDAGKVISVMMPDGTIAYRPPLPRSRREGRYVSRFQSRFKKGKF